MNARRFRRFPLVLDMLRTRRAAIDSPAASHRRRRATSARGLCAAHPVTLAAWFAFAVHASMVQAQATLPLAPDRSAGGRHPEVGVAANRVPVVQIVEPNAAGVSHNRFTHYNVGTAGIVLNNSGMASRTQTAGWVGGNPLLGNRNARLILNEVTSGNPSRLLGMTEVAGRAANVVLANPAGIYCNGCGFINAPRATLSTGVPVLNGDGSLTALTVMQGALTIDEEGLDARGSSQLDLLAQALRINGQVWSQRIDAVAGAHRVSYRSGDVAALENGRGGGNPPIVAIDVAALGGMHANSVRLVGNERGVGVNLEGTVNSLTGDIRLSSTGDIIIAQGGSLRAARHAVIHAASVRNAGAIAAGSDIAVRATDVNNVDGKLDAERGTLDVRAQDTLTNEGGQMRGKTVTVQAAGELINLDGHIAATDALRIDAATLVNVDGKISGESVRIDAAEALKNDGGDIAASKALDVKAGALSNHDGLLTSAGTATLVTASRFGNADGTLRAAGDVDVRAADIDNADGTIESTNGTLNVMSERMLQGNDDDTRASPDEDA